MKIAECKRHLKACSIEEKKWHDLPNGKRRVIKTKRWSNALARALPEETKLNIAKCLTRERLPIPSTFLENANKDVTSWLRTMGYATAFYKKDGEWEYGLPSDLPDDVVVNVATHEIALHATGTLPPMVTPGINKILEPESIPVPLKNTPTPTM